MTSNDPASCTFFGSNPSSFLVSSGDPLPLKFNRDLSFCLLCLCTFTIFEGSVGFILCSFCLCLILLGKKKGLFFRRQWNFVRKDVMFFESLLQIGSIKSIISVIKFTSRNFLFILFILVTDRVVSHCNSQMHSPTPMYYVRKNAPIRCVTTPLGYWQNLMSFLSPSLGFLVIVVFHRIWKIHKNMNFRNIGY